MNRLKTQDVYIIINQNDECDGQLKSMDGEELWLWLWHMLAIYSVLFSSKANQNDGYTEALFILLLLFDIIAI